MESDPTLYKPPIPKPILLLFIPFILAFSLIFSWVYVDNLVIRPAEQKRYNSTVMVSDFVVPYAAALLAIDGTPEQAFDIKKIHSIEKQVSNNLSMPPIPWPYPPFYQLLIMPLGNFDYITAYRLYVAITLTMLTIVAYCIASYWLTPSLVIIFPALAFCVAVGQNGILSASFIGAGLLLLKRRPIVAGIAFGLMAYKPHLAVAIPFCLLAGRYYRVLVATGLTALATILISILAFGTKPLIAFFLNLTSHSQIVFDHHSDLLLRMPTIMAMMLQLTDSKTFASAVQILVSVTALAGSAWVWRRSDQDWQKALALTASIPLATPYFFDYDMAIFSIPFVFLAKEVWTAGFTYQRALIITTLWLAPPMFFLFPPTCQIGPLVWLGLLGYVVYHVAKQGHDKPLSAWVSDVTSEID